MMADPGRVRPRLVPEVAPGRRAPNSGQVFAGRIVSTTSATRRKFGKPFKPTA